MKSAEMLVSETNSTKNGLRRLAGNMASMFSSDAITRAATFVLYASVARFLGTLNFGRMSLALMFLNTFQVLAPAGLRFLITREVARDRSKTEIYLINGNLIAAVFSILCLAVLSLFIMVAGYSRDTSIMILVFGIGVLPFSLSTVCEAVFQAWERMDYIVWVNVPRNILVVTLGILFLSRGMGLVSIGWLLSAASLFVLLIEWAVLLRFIIRPRLTLDLGFCAALARATIPFLGFQGTVAFTGSLTYFILSKLAGETEVGLYNAATQIVSPVALFYQNIVIGAFPVMVHRYEAGMQSLKKISDQLLELVFTISLPAAAGLFLFAQPVLLLLYAKTDFAQAGVLLQILTFTLVLESFIAVFGRQLMVCLKEKVIFKIVLVNALVNVAACFAGLSIFGLIGFAYASLLVTVINFGLHYFQVAKLYPRVMPWRLFWKPIAASLLMVVFLANAKNLGTIEVIFLAAGIYTMAWLVLSILSAGSFPRLIAVYSRLWTE